MIGMHFLAIEINSSPGFLYELAIFKTRCAEYYIVSIPFSQSVVCVVGRFCLINQRTQAVFGRVSVEDLYLVTVLQINTAVAPLIGDEKFDVCAEIAKFFFRHDIGSPVLTSGGSGVIRVQDRSLV